MAKVIATALHEIVLGPPSKTEVYHPGVCFELSEEHAEDLRRLGAIREATESEMILAGFRTVEKPKAERKTRAKASDPVETPGDDDALV